MLHKALQDQRMRIVIALLASLVQAFCVNYFIVPMGLYSSGVLGCCQVVRTLIIEALDLSTSTDFSGLLYMAVNVPVFLWAWRVLGRGFLVRSIIGTASISLFLSMIPVPAVPLIDDRLTCCMIGGIIAGLTSGLIFTCGFSGGGLDTVGLCLAKRNANFTVGRFSMSFNVVLYAVCLFLFDVPTVIYSVIYMVFTSLFIDRLHQQNIAEQVMIFTRDEDPELPRAIMTRLGRGVTYWEGKGAYTGNDIRVLCVCVSKFEEADLYAIIHELDPQAFFITQEGVSINGNFPKKIS